MYIHTHIIHHIPEVFQQIKPSIIPLKLLTLHFPPPNPDSQSLLNKYWNCPSVDRARFLSLLQGPQFRCPALLLSPFYLNYFSSAPCNHSQYSDYIPITCPWYTTSIVQTGEGGPRWEITASSPTGVGLGGGSCGWDCGVALYGRRTFNCVASTFGSGQTRQLCTGPCPMRKENRDVSQPYRRTTTTAPVLHDPFHGLAS